MATWKFLLRSPNRRGFRYRETYLMTSGAIHQEDWVSRDKDGALVVGNALGRVVNVEVYPTDIGVGAQVRRPSSGSTTRTL